MPNTELVIVEGQDLSQIGLGSDNQHVSIRRDGPVVVVEVGNGGDFGETNWQLEPADAIRLAEALLRYARTVNEVA